MTAIDAVSGQPLDESFVHFVSRLRNASSNSAVSKFFCLFFVLFSVEDKSEFCSFKRARNAIGIYLEDQREQTNYE
jgi:hypothetical protein